MPVPSSAPVSMPTPVESASLSTASAVRARPNWPFLLGHVPTDWEVEVLDGKPALLPVLRQLALQPGVNMVRTRDRHEPTDVAVSDCTRYAQSRGWVVLDIGIHVEAAHLPKGVPAGRYLRELPARALPNDEVGKLYLDAWEVPVATPVGEEQVFRRDRAAYARWRAHLVTSGVIPEPSEVVRERMLARAKVRLERKQATPYPDADLKKDRVSAAREAIKSIEAAKVPGSEAA